MFGDITLSGRTYVKAVADKLSSLFVSSDSNSLVARAMEVRKQDSTGKGGALLALKRLVSIRNTYATGTVGSDPYSTVNLSTYQSKHPLATDAELDAQLQAMSAFLSSDVNRSKIIRGEL